MVEYDARPLRFTRFQQGVDGYAGGVDTRLRGAYPDTSYAADATLSVDGEDYGYQTQSLVRFGQIIGSDAAQIPAGALIVGARLRVYTANRTKNNSVMFHRMLTTWEDTDTWNSMTDGVSADGTEAVATADIHLPPDDRTAWRHEVDVTASLRAWVEDGAPNLGWALLPTGTDGWQFRSADGAEPPQLVVWYQVLGDLNCDGVCDAIDVEPFVLALVNPDAYELAYPDCDIMLADANRDGNVNLFDIDAFVALLARG